MTETAGQAWMNMELEGKVAIVTGAAGGIEREIVRGLPGAGAKVAAFVELPYSASCGHAPPYRQLLQRGRRSREIRRPDPAEPCRA